MDQRIQQIKKNANSNDEAKNNRKHGLHPFDRAHRKGTKRESGTAEKQINQVSHRKSPYGADRCFLRPFGVRWLFRKLGDGVKAA